MAEGYRWFVGRSIERRRWAKQLAGVLEMGLAGGAGDQPVVSDGRMTDVQTCPLESE